jgi:hypothetical protein
LTVERFVQCFEATEQKVPTNGAGVIREARIPDEERHDCFVRAQSFAERRIVREAKVSAKPHHPDTPSRL